MPYLKTIYNYCLIQLTVIIQLTITVTYCRTIYNYCHIKVPIIVNLYTVTIILHFIWFHFKNNLQLLSNLINNNCHFIFFLQLLSNLINNKCQFIFIKTHIDQVTIIVIFNYIIPKSKLYLNSDNNCKWQLLSLLII